MKTKLINSSYNETNGFGAGGGNIECYEYDCLCGNGRIVEEHDNTPGFRDHSVYLSCEKCKENYNLDVSKGVRNWELVRKNR